MVHHVESLSIINQDHAAYMIIGFPLSSKTNIWFDLFDLFNLFDLIYLIYSLPN